MSQNAVFRAPDAGGTRPPGSALACAVREALSLPPWRVGDVENWRDVGWSLACALGGAEVEVVLCAVDDGEWALQVAPRAQPGFVASMLGAKPSAAPGDVQDVAVLVHGALQRAGAVDLRWRWDGLPDAEHGSVAPDADP